MRGSLAGAVRSGAAAILLLSSASYGATTTLTGALSGPASNPPNASPGIGFTTVTYNSTTHILTVNITFSFLAGTTTASHIHCCVVPNGNAGVATTVPTFPGFPLGVTAGTYSQSLDLTLASSFNSAFVTANGGTLAAAEAALVNGLGSGMAYVNIHTALYPGGEIRSFLVLAAPPAVSKSFAPPATSLGGASVLTITLSNSNAAPITGAAFVDTYPANLVNSATPAGATTCAGGSVVAAAGGGSVSLSGGAIPASGSCTVTVNVTSSVVNSYPNSIPAGGVSTTNAGSSTGAANATLVVSLLAAPPAVSKSFAPPATPLGGTSALTITLSNPNAAPITGAAFVDTYPANLVNSATPAGATTCAGGSVVAAAGGGSVSLSGGAIPASGSCTVTVNVTSSVVNSYPNSIPAGGISTTNAGSSTGAANATLAVGGSSASNIPALSPRGLMILAGLLALAGLLLSRRL